MVTKPKHFWKGNATDLYDTLDEYVKNFDGSGVNYNSFRLFHNIGQWIIIGFAVFNLFKEVS